MADSTATIGLTVKIDGIDREISSLKDLKQAKKDATDAFLRGDKDAAKALADLKDKTEDLTDATQTLKGSGVEKLTSSFSQLKDGFSSFDGDKISTAFKGIGAAMKAIPLLLIIEGIRYLVENFEELSSGSGFLAKALRFVGDIITSVKDIIFEFTDAIGLTNTALDKLGDSTLENANKAKEALAAQTAEYDRQIAIAKASGKSAVDLEKAKQQAIIDTNKALVEQTIAYVREGGQLNEEKKKLLTEQLTAIKNARVQQQVIDITENAKELDRYKKLQEDKQKAELDAWNKTVEIRISNKAAQDADDKRLAEEKKAQDEIDRQASLDYMNSVGNDEKAITDTTYDYKKAKRDQELEEFKQNTEAQLNATKQGLQAAQSITDIFFNYKLNKHKGDAKAENEIRKKQFNVNKAFGITNAVIDGIGAVQKALNNPYPLNIILAAVSGIAAAANIAKIASTKFEPTSSGDSGGGGATSIPVPAPPTINTPNANTNSNTTFDENGKRIGEGEKSGQPTINVKATVGVDEITDKSNRVQVLEQQSTF